MEQNSRAGVDRIAVVIGAGTIGQAIARHLVASGFEVHVAGHDHLELAKFETVQRFLGGFGCIDVLVNAAGTYGEIGRVGDVAPEAWGRAIEVNLLGAYAVCHYGLRRLAAGGHLINLAGGGAVSPVSHLSDYGASKAALVRLTQTIALEYPGLHANCISPGPIVSRMQQQLLAAGPAVPAYGAIRAMVESGVDEVPVERTLRVVDHILDEGPSGELFFSRTFDAARGRQAAEAAVATAQGRVSA